MRDVATRALDTPVETKTLGLCLSGGGFRASFYALGILRYLAEAGHLPRLACVSAVSGGSIAAAAAADRWTDFEEAGGDVSAFQTIIDEPFRTTVTGKNLRRRWMGGSLVAVVPGLGGRGGALDRTLAHNLYRHERLADLPHRPEFIFTATDLSTGHAFRAAPAYIGSWDYGYIEPTPTSLSLATAVAASAAFPLSLAVVRISSKRLAFPKPRVPGKIPLVDGGVYDNLGLEWFQGWGPDSIRPKAAVNPELRIVANASGILETKNKRFRPAGALMRDLQIQYQQVLALRTRWEFERAKAKPGTWIYLAVKHDPRKDSSVAAVAAAALPSELVEPLALLRTDLDRFSREEADLLSYHAYWTLHARLATYRPELALRDPAWTEYASLAPAETARLRRLLNLGSHRFFRRTRRLIRRP